MKKIGQSECLEILEKFDEWFTAKEIANKLNQQSGSVNTSLAKLYSYREIMRRNSTKTKVGYEYRRI